MKIAIIADHHLGYQRFEEDSYAQTEQAIILASEQADLIICAGDIFDTKIPKLETLKRAVDIFKKAKIPIFAIHGNHERRSKEMTNPVQLLAASTNITLLHGESKLFEKNGEKIQIFGIGSVPEEYAAIALKKAMEKYSKIDDGQNILAIHQTINELVPGSEEGISLEYLETLPFDLIVNGHIHETITKLGGKLLIPGSTVITQLKKSETLPKGYFLYDTATKKAEFIEVDTRKFFYEELEFHEAGELEIREAIQKRIRDIREEHPKAIIAIKIDGTIKKGLTTSDIKLDDYENVYIKNNLNMESLSATLERIRGINQDNSSMKEVALKELREKTKEKVTAFDSAELFEKLLIGVDETIEYLEKHDLNRQEQKE